MPEDNLYLEPVRARRRREKNNAIRRAVKYIVSGYYFPEDNEGILDQARKRADNFTICSCELCCNPRRTDWTSSKEHLTYQELKAKVDLKQQYEEHNLRLPVNRTGKLNGG